MLHLIFVAVGFPVIWVAMGNGVFNYIDVAMLESGSSRKKTKRKKTLLVAPLCLFLDHLA